ncbi:hypothetical protein IHE45_14G025300 [Dioscorea alata]|uniref:Uncharacterized protein n=4 Tax=Dioscorea alata TaxID=55571 RepID=A0ACB7UQV0_DIOAL|nr:hypothetical protein IHE45_14G025300 [Dioscorea alata]
MAALSLVTPTSPNSVRLCFRRRCWVPSPVIIRLRSLKPDRRLRLDCACWASSNSSQDSFAGWSSETGGDGSPKEDRFGGMVGAGLAGLFFASGVAFAALSLSGRKTNRVKPQMESIAVEQEVLLTSDDENKRMDQDGNYQSRQLMESDNKINDQNSDIETGSNQDDVQTVPDVDSIPMPADSNPVSSDLIVHDEHEISIDVSTINDSQSTTTSNSVHENYEHEGPNTVDESSIDSDSTTHITDNQEGSSSPETVKYDDPLNFSSELEGQLPSDILSSDPIVLEQGGLSNDDIGSEEVTRTESSIEDLEAPNYITTSVSLEDGLNETKLSVVTSASDLEQNEVLESLDEPVIAEELKINESESGSATLDPNGNESDEGMNIQTNRSSLFKSLLPEKSFSSAGIPAPLVVSAALQVSPGNVLVPAVVDQVQGKAFAALQVLKVIEADVQPGDLCTRREYARWLVTASSALSRNTASKVYPAMYIENVTELAFDDITPEDPDFACIQGLAEAGLISSKLSMPDVPSGEHNAPVLFSPESPLCRQDLVSWKMVLEKRQLLEVDKNSLYKCSGYLDIEKINPEAWPALVADLSGGEQGIIALAFGYTRLFQPYKPVTKAQAAIALATGDAADVVGEELTRIEAESLAETAVNAHTALVAQVEKDLNASFENELAKEREKIGALEKLAEEARLELERLRTEREEENNALLRGRAAVESEIEVLSKLRLEVEEQLQNLMSDKVGISFERDRINKLREQAEKENQVIAQLQYELEVEKKALSMARTWAEEEAKRARENARALEAARDRWEGRGIKVVVDEDLQDDASAGITWVSAGEQVSDNETTINRAENLVKTLKEMAGELKLRSSAVINNIYQKINSFISALKQQAVDASKHAAELRSSIILKGKKSVKEIQEKASDFGANVGYRTKRVFEDCKESVEKLQQKFKT